MKKNIRMASGSKRAIRQVYPLKMLSMNVSNLELWPGGYAEERDVCQIQSAGIDSVAVGILEGVVVDIIVR